MIDFARSTFPEAYTGFSMDGSTIVIHRVPAPGSPLDQAIKKRYPTQATRVEDALRNEIQLKELADRVARDREYWRSKGVDITNYGLDAPQGVVGVGISQADSSAQAKFTDRYGDGVVVTQCFEEGVNIPAESG